MNLYLIGQAFEDEPAVLIRVDGCEGEMWTGAIIWPDDQATDTTEGAYDENHRELFTAPDDSTAIERYRS